MSPLFCLHTVLDQCVEIQATASIFSPALFPIWCAIGDIILQLSSHGAAVNGDAGLCTGRSTAFVLRVHAGPLGAEERWTHLNYSDIPEWLNLKLQNVSLFIARMDRILGVKAKIKKLFALAWPFLKRLLSKVHA